LITQAEEEIPHRFELSLIKISSNTQLLIAEERIKNAVVGPIRAIHRMTLARQESSIQIDYDDFIFIANSSSTPSEFRPLVKMMKAIRSNASLLLSDAGEIIEILNLDELSTLIEDDAADYAEYSIHPADRDESIRERRDLTINLFLSSFEMEFLKDWNLWLGQWIGASLNMGEKVEKSDLIEFDDGTSVLSEVRILNKGPSESHENAFVLERQETRTGNLLNLMDPTAEKSSVNDAFSNSMTERPIRTKTMSVGHFDSETFRPIAIILRTYVTMHSELLGDSTIQEKRSYKFTWSDEDN